MKKILSIFVIICFLIPAESSAAVKSGLTCKTKGQVKISYGYKYVCIKSKKKLVWNSGTKIVKEQVNSIPEPTPTTKAETVAPENVISPVPVSEVSFPSFTNRCEKDPLTPEEWKEWDNFYYKNARCSNSFYRYQPMTNSDYTGNLELKTNLLDIGSCKIKNTKPFPMLGFSNAQETRGPRPDTIFQVVPVSFTDADPIGTPKEDYGKWFDLVSGWIKNNSDNGSTSEIRVPNNYIRIQKSLSSYQNMDIHTKPSKEAEQFYKDVINLSDPYINFSNTDIVIVVVPPQTDPALLGGQPWGVPIQTAEGLVDQYLVIPPANMNKFHYNSSFTSPMMWLHEVHHSSLDFGDHENGMGMLGMMSAPLAMDLLGWEKYLSGFISDDQVMCISKEQSSLNLIKPISLFGKHKKLIVIPFSNTRVLVMESLKAGGYNYKLNSKEQGLLVYEVELNKPYHDDNETVISNGKRKKEESALKVGESILYNGIKISVLESGDFGDIVKIEPIG